MRCATWVSCRMTLPRNSGQMPRNLNQAPRHLAAPEIKCHGTWWYLKSSVCFAATCMNVSAALLACVQDIRTYQRLGLPACNMHECISDSACLLAISTSVPMALLVCLQMCEYITDSACLNARCTSASTTVPALNLQP